MQVWFLNVLDRHWNIEFPTENLFVVGCAEKFAALIIERNSIAWLQVVVVLLRHSTRPRIPLIDFVIGRGTQEHIVVVGIKFHYEIDCVRKEIERGIKI